MIPLFLLSLEFQNIEPRHILCARSRRDIRDRTGVSPTVVTVPLTDLVELTRGQCSVFRQAASEGGEEQCSSPSRVGHLIRQN